MSDSDLKHLTPDAAEFGENVARFFQVVAKLLLDWSDEERKRRQLKSGSATVAVGTKVAGTLPHLTAIYFDKLAMFYCRLWDQLHKDNRAVRYNSGFLPTRGFHGQGPAIKINRSEDERIGMGKHPSDFRHSKYAFITEVVEKLKPGIGDARVLFRLDGDPPWMAGCRVHPQLERNVWDTWCSPSVGEKGLGAFLNGIELTYVSFISFGIACLSQEEIRAIGTHSTAGQLCRDISFNLVAWQDDFNKIVQALAEGLRGSELAANARELVVTSREVMRKSIENRPDYEGAYAKFIAQVSTQPAIVQAFRKVQADGKQIWQNGLIVSYAGIAPILFAFSVYCRRVLLELGRIDGLTARETDESSQQFPVLAHWCQTKGLMLPGYDTMPHASAPEVAKFLTSIREKIFEAMPEEESVREAGVV